MGNRILILSQDILPFPGCPTTGAGLRAWGLGQGLRSAGHEVRFLMPQTDRYPLSEEIRRESLWTPESLNPAVRDMRPDVIILQYYGGVELLNEEHLETPIVIDFEGPVLLEQIYTGYRDLPTNIRGMIENIREGDFFLCIGDRQKAFFSSWLMLAGFDITEPDLLGSIPISFPPSLPVHRFSKEPVLVYGGTFLPWVDPSSALEIVVERLERRGRGMLHFFGGRHPLHGTDAPVFQRLKEKLGKSSRVLFHDLLPYGQIVEFYSRAHMAVDLMERNCEREFAFPGRTVTYLWCGLPVLHNDYSELSRYIREYRAGWALNPNDRESILKAVDVVLDDPATLSRYSENAQRLVRENLLWDRTIGPLDAFCRNPRKREPGKTPLSLEDASKISERPRDLRDAIAREGFRQTAQETLKYLLRKIR